MSLCQRTSLCLSVKELLFVSLSKNLSVGKAVAAVFKDGKEVCHGLGAEHGNAGLAEVGDAFEDGGSGQVQSVKRSAT